MAKYHLAFLPPPPISDIAHGSTAFATPRVKKTSPPSPENILGLTKSVPLHNPRAEHKCVVMLEIAIFCGREPSRALDL